MTDTQQTCKSEVNSQIKNKGMHLQHDITTYKSIKVSFEMSHFDQKVQKLCRVFSVLVIFGF
jgi:hypothetical protein